ncbi:hypothetical protein V6N12_045836 [Hibiscus sabdariffa]|uniref:Uncharacterized protein n=1 Tax=Hibiscus sabdariffa TaxID=183260 RepID=A0ABR2G3W0_9ROSI
MNFDILAEIYVREVIRLHGVPTSMVSDRDPKFTSQFWKPLQKAFGTRVNLSTAFHLQTDGQSERMAPLEALYGRRCRTPLCWSELGENKELGPQMIQDTEKQVQIIHDTLKQAFDEQKAYADTKRRDIRYDVGDKVFLKVSPWKKFL